LSKFVIILQFTKDHYISFVKTHRGFGCQRMSELFASIVATSGGEEVSNVKLKMNVEP